MTDNLKKPLLNILIVLVVFLMQQSSLVAAQLEEPAAEPAAPFVGISRVWPNLRFERPVFLTGAGDGSGRIFVVEQQGVIRVFKKTAGQDTSSVKSSSVFLDIRELVNRQGNEEGLLGLAFHPDFKNNGQFFVHYSSRRNKPKKLSGVAPNVISRFVVSADDPDVADVDSEEIILGQKQPYRNHNGGMIAFGPDGYLYASFGDGGFKDDPQGNGQKLSSWLGSIIRIDVDRKQDRAKYAVPADNPFVGQAKVRPELWAIGLRNVWRFSFDRDDGTLFAADVGQNRFEEVNVITKGGNYGWNRYEANDDFDRKTKLTLDENIKPVASYGREWGISITGGYVYRGKDFPQLQGYYFYGDYVSGNLWSLKKTADGKYHNSLARRTGRSIASFGEDDEGELYLVSFDGGIYRVVVTSEPEDTFADWPKLLSDTDFYVSTADKKLSPRMIPYMVNAPFWSDGADKQRYLMLPDGEKLGYRDVGSWEVPVGTTLLKNFEVRRDSRRRPIETRLIKRVESGWESATYVWDRKGKDAELLPSGKQFELGLGHGLTTWHAPSSSECASCHVDAAGYVLGLNTAQLNRQLDDKNQITILQENGWLELPADFDLASAAKFHSAADESGTLEQQVRTYLDVNCAMCHQPTGPGNANIDLRYEVALEKTRMIDELPAQGDMGIAGARVVSRGNPDKSLLLKRIETLGAGRMPVIGSNVVDEAAVELIREWIESLE